VIDQVIGKVIGLLLGRAMPARRPLAPRLRPALCDSQRSSQPIPAAARPRKAAQSARDHAARRTRGTRERELATNPTVALTARRS